ncbi:MAG TPA: cytochrome c [Acidobacteriota bacterium]|nr:cytochrome c [Acidobacteriota bacterium]
MKKTLILAFIWVAALYLIHVLFGEKADRRGLEYFPDMAYSKAAETQGAYSVFPGQMTQQLPVPGTFHRDQPLVQFSADEEGRRKAGEELANPLQSSSDRSQEEDAATAGRGRVLYSRFCQPCHGTNGEGDGAVVRRGYPPPPSLRRPTTVGYADGELYHIISYGIGNMPAYRSLIPLEERWMIVRHLRELQRQGQSVSVEEGP